jgi:hypothetical protein
MKKDKPESESTTDILNSICLDGDEDAINVGTLLKTISEGGFALVNMVCALILMIPTPPPIAIIMGLAVMFFSWQMFIGYKSVWLPKYVTEKNIPRHVVSLSVEKSVFYLYKLEKLTHRRFLFMISEKAKKVSGLFMFILALISLSPLLFANTIPGIAIVLICFGILNKDGFLIIIGYLVGIIGIVIAWYMVMFGATMFFKLINKLFK